MSAAKPYVILDDDDDDGPMYSEDTGDDLVDFGELTLSKLETSFTNAPTLVSEDSEPEITAESQRPNPRVSSTHRSTRPASACPAEVSIGSYRLAKGVVIRVEDTVELYDHQARQADTMHSGDFLKVKQIIQNLDTDQVRLRGHRMRRTKYLGQVFDWKLNELAMVLRINEGDKLPPFSAGLEDVDVNEVIRIRECTLTNKPYPLLSFRTGGRSAFPVNMSKEEIKRQLFHGGRLTCRVVNVQYIHTNGKSYHGVVRHLYACEADAVKQTDLNWPSSVTAQVDQDDYVVVSQHSSTIPLRQRAASSGVEILEGPPRRNPVHNNPFTFGDVCCGVGGASEGARQAGYSVKFGLDHDDQAIEAYTLNHPGAHAFKMDAHDFPPRGITKDAWKVDVLHFSPPCCYWSPAHTRDGANDQANYEAIYTVGPILKKVKPRVATVEQTSGLATHEEHKRNFFQLLNDIGQAGYNVRYKIQDLSEFGLAQKRKRLLIIAARRGTPLPPFPKSTHGPPGSGLKPFTTIEKALLPLTGLGSRAEHDMYHQPKLFSSPRPRESFGSFLKGCITTGGTTTYHPSGTRHFTVRELSLLQSFPYGYAFTGTKTEASKQVGNAFPPIMAKALFRTIAKTLRAFDKGLIGAEEANLEDMDELTSDGNEIIELIDDDDDDDDEVIELSDGD